METNKTKTSLSSKRGIGAVVGIIVLIASLGLVLAQGNGLLVSELLAGQDIPVGSAVVSDDTENIYVNIFANEGWVIRELHVQIADELDGIPQTKTENPIPGQFEYNVEFETPVTSYTVTKLISDLGVTDEDNLVAIAVQADVYNPVTGENETAWASGSQFEGKNWATYFVYGIGSGIPE